MKHFDAFSLPYLSFSLFCIVLNIALCMNITQINTHIPIPVGNERCVFEHLQDLRLKKPKKVTIGHLNINSIPNKFDGIMDFVATNLDVFSISENKLMVPVQRLSFCMIIILSPIERIEP